LRVFSGQLLMRYRRDVILAYEVPAVP